MFAYLSKKIGINVPLFADRKQKQAISQRRSEVKQQQYALQDSWLTIQADIASTLADYERRQQQILLYNTGVLPQARLQSLYPHARPKLAPLLHARQDFGTAITRLIMIMFLNQKILLLPYQGRNSRRL